jgi:hypothetical protein
VAIHASMVLRRSSPIEIERQLGRIIPNMRDAMKKTLGWLGRYTLWIIAAYGFAWFVRDVLEMPKTRKCSCWRLLAF